MIDITTERMWTKIREEEQDVEMRKAKTPSGHVEEPEATVPSEDVKKRRQAYDEEEEEHTSRGYRIMSVFRTIFIYVLSAAIIIAALMFAASRSPQKAIFGYRYYTVLTPSMEPEFSVGDVVIVKLANADEIQVGDVITFNPSSESDAYLTHRVTEVLPDYQGTGITCFKTKGDANDVEDSFILDSSRLIGKVTTHIPAVGYIVRFVQLKWYFVVPIVIMIFIFFEFLRVYLSSGKDEEEKI